MPGPNRAPRGGYQKPKDLGKTISRLLGYLTRSKLPLMAVFGCLLISVFTNIGGSYMMRGIINDFIWSGCTDFAGLGRAILVLVGIYLIGCAATYGQSAVMVRLASGGSTGCARTCSTNCRTCRFPTLTSTPTAS